MSSSSSSKSPSVEVIVYEFISLRLKEKGYHGWSVPSDIRSNPVLSQIERDRVQGSLTKLTQELFEIAELGEQIKEMSSGFLAANPFDISYKCFESAVSELFAEGIRWSHILTLLVFASEIAHSRGVTQGVAGFINNVADWCTQYISSPALLSWINDHGGWVCFETFTSLGLEHVCVGGTNCCCLFVPLLCRKELLRMKMIVTAATVTMQMVSKQVVMH